MRRIAIFVICTTIIATVITLTAVLGLNLLSTNVIETTASERISIVLCPSILTFDYRIHAIRTPIAKAIECLETAAHVGHWRQNQQKIATIDTLILVDPRILVADCIGLEYGDISRVECVQWGERYFAAVHEILTDESITLHTIAPIAHYNGIAIFDAITWERDPFLTPLPLLAADGRWGYYHDVLLPNEWALDMCGTWVSRMELCVCPDDVLWTTTFFQHESRNYHDEVQRLIDSISDNCPHLQQAQGLVLYYSSNPAARTPIIRHTDLINVAIHSPSTGIPDWIQRIPGVSYNFIRTELFHDAPAHLLSNARYIMMIDADIVFLSDPLAWLSPRHLRMTPATTIDSAVAAFNDERTWTTHKLQDITERKIMHHYSSTTIPTYWFYNGGQVWAPASVLAPFLESESRHAHMEIAVDGHLYGRDMFMMAMAYYETQPPFMPLPVALNLDSALVLHHPTWACANLVDAPVIAYHYHGITTPDTHTPTVTELGKCPALDDLRTILGQPSSDQRVPSQPPSYDSLLDTLHQHLTSQHGRALVVHQHTRKAGGGELRHQAYIHGLFEHGGCEIQNACLDLDACADVSNAPPPPPLLLITSVRDPVSRLESDFNWEGPGGSQAWARDTWPQRLDTDIEHWSIDQWRAWMQWPSDWAILEQEEPVGVRMRGVYVANYATQLLGSDHHKRGDGGFTNPVGYHLAIPCEASKAPCLETRAIRRVTDRAETEIMLERAKRFLEDMFVLAVPHDQAATTYFWDLVDDIVGIHTHVDSTMTVHANDHRYQFPDTIRQDIARENWADQALYNFVRTLHEQRDPCASLRTRTYSGDQEAPSRVFLISMHKTATTTWTAMMEDLGYHVARADSHSEPPTWRRRTACSHLELGMGTHHFTAFQDVPWFLFYREAAELIPGAKFVFIHRPDAEWLESAMHHFTVRPPSPWRAYLYGEECNTRANVAPPPQCLSRILDVYQSHRRDVLEFFRHSDHQLLQLDISNLTQSEADRHAQFCKGPNAPPSPMWRHENEHG